MVENIIDISEREKITVTSLIEEYKTKWLQLSALDSKVNKWSASYEAALILGISWILGSDKVQNLSELFANKMEQ